VLRADGNAARELGRHFIAGYTSFDEVAPLAAKGLIGGIYVTRHNIEGRTADDLKSEIARLQSLRSAAELAPLIVAVDQEGGIVSHMSPPLTSLPALATLAALPRAERSSKAEAAGKTHGRELAALGITLNFAPVVDLLRPEMAHTLDFNSFISRRAIAADPEVVTEIALAYVRGLEASGVEATLKHFPSLGRVHEDTPSLPRRYRYAGCRTRSLRLASVSPAAATIEYPSDGRSRRGHRDRSGSGGVLFEARDRRPDPEGVGISGTGHHR
jgi:beta-N-acetylhexosaminidase